MSRQKHSFVVFTMSGLTLLHFAFMTKPRTADLSLPPLKLPIKTPLLAEASVPESVALPQIDWPQGEAGEVELTIHDLTGRPVRRLFRGEPPREHARISWDGNDDAGQPAPAGKYWYRFTTAKRMYSRMLTVTR